MVQAIKDALIMSGVRFWSICDLTHNNVRSPAILGLTFSFIIAGALSFLVLLLTPPSTPGLSMTVISIPNSKTFLGAPLPSMSFQLQRANGVALSGVKLSLELVPAIPFEVETRILNQLVPNYVVNCRSDKYWRRRPYFCNMSAVPGAQTQHSVTTNHNGLAVVHDLALNYGPPGEYQLRVKTVKAVSEFPDIERTLSVSFFAAVEKMDIVTTSYDENTGDLGAVVEVITKMNATVLSNQLASVIPMRFPTISSVVPGWLPVSKINVDDEAIIHPNKIFFAVKDCVQISQNESRGRITVKTSIIGSSGSLFGAALFFGGVSVPITSLSGPQYSPRTVAFPFVAQYGKEISSISFGPTKPPVVVYEATPAVITVTVLNSAKQGVDGVVVMFRAVREMENSAVSRHIVPKYLPFNVSTATDTNGVARLDSDILFSLQGEVGRYRIYANVGALNQSYPMLVRTRAKPIPSITFTKLMQYPRITIQSEEIISSRLQFVVQDRRATSGVVFPLPGKVAELEVVADYRNESVRLETSPTELVSDSQGFFYVDGLRLFVKSKANWTLARNFTGHIRATVDGQLVHAMPIAVGIPAKKNLTRAILFLGAKANPCQPFNITTQRRPISAPISLDFIVRLTSFGNAPIRDAVIYGPMSDAGISMEFAMGKYRGNVTGIYRITVKSSLSSVPPYSLFNAFLISKKCLPSRDTLVPWVSGQHLSFIVLPDERNITTPQEEVRENTTSDEVIVNHYVRGSPFPNETKFMYYPAWLPEQNFERSRLSSTGLEMNCSHELLAASLTHVECKLPRTAFTYPGEYIFVPNLFGVFYIDAKVIFTVRVKDQQEVYKTYRPGVAMKGQYQDCYQSSTVPFVRLRFFLQYDPLTPMIQRDPLTVGDGLPPGTAVFFKLRRKLKDGTIVGVYDPWNNASHMKYGALARLLTSKNDPAAQYEAEDNTAAQQGEYQGDGAVDGGEEITTDTGGEYAGSGDYTGDDGYGSDGYGGDTVGSDYLDDYGYGASDSYGGGSDTYGDFSQDGSYGSYDPNAYDESAGFSDYGSFSDSSSSSFGGGSSSSSFGGGSSSFGGSSSSAFGSLSSSSSSFGASSSSSLGSSSSSGSSLGSSSASSSSGSSIGSSSGSSSSGSLARHAAVMSGSSSSGSSGSSGSSSSGGSSSLGSSSSSLGSSSGSGSYLGSSSGSYDYYDYTDTTDMTTFLADLKKGKVAKSYIAPPIAYTEDVMSGGVAVQSGMVQVDLMDLAGFRTENKDDILEIVMEVDGVETNASWIIGDEHSTDAFGIDNSGENYISVCEKDVVMPAPTKSGVSSAPGIIGPAIHMRFVWKTTADMVWSNGFISTVECRDSLTQQPVTCEVDTAKTGKTYFARFFITKTLTMNFAGIVFPNSVQTQRTYDVLVNFPGFNSPFRAFQVYLGLDGCVGQVTQQLPSPIQAATTYPVATTFTCANLPLKRTLVQASTKITFSGSTEECVADDCGVLSSPADLAVTDSKGIARFGLLVTSAPAGTATISFSPATSLVFDRAAALEAVYAAGIGTPINGIEVGDSINNAFDVEDTGRLARLFATLSSVLAQTNRPAVAKPVQITTLPLRINIISDLSPVSGITFSNLETPLKFLKKPMFIEVKTSGTQANAEFGVIQRVNIEVWNAAGSKRLLTNYVSFANSTRSWFMTDSQGEGVLPSSALIHGPGGSFTLRFNCRGVRSPASKPFTVINPAAASVADLKSQAQSMTSMFLLISLPFLFGNVSEFPIIVGVLSFLMCVAAMSGAPAMFDIGKMMIETPLIGCHIFVTYLIVYLLATSFLCMIIMYLVSGKVPWARSIDREEKSVRAFRYFRWLTNSRPSVKKTSQDEFDEVVDGHTNNLMHKVTKPIHILLDKIFSWSEPFKFNVMKTIAEWEDVRAIDFEQAPNDPPNYLLPPTPPRYVLVMGISITLMIFMTYAGATLLMFIDRFLKIFKAYLDVIGGQSASVFNETVLTTLKKSVNLVIEKFPNFQFLRSLIPLIEMLDLGAMIKAVSVLVDALNASAVAVGVIALTLSFVGTAYTLSRAGTIRYEILKIRRKFDFNSDLTDAEDYVGIHTVIFAFQAFASFIILYIFLLLMIVFFAYLPAIWQWFWTSEETASLGTLALITLCIKQFMTYFAHTNLYVHLPVIYGIWCIPAALNSIFIGIGVLIFRVIAHLFVGLGFSFAVVTRPMIDPLEDPVFVGFSAMANIDAMYSNPTLLSAVSLFLALIEQKKYYQKQEGRCKTIANIFAQNGGKVPIYSSSLSSSSTTQTPPSLAPPKKPACPQDFGNHCFYSHIGFLIKMWIGYDMSLFDNDPWFDEARRDPADEESKNDPMYPLSEEEIKERLEKEKETNKEKGNENAPLRKIGKRKVTTFDAEKRTVLQKFCGLFFPSSGIDIHQTSEEVAALKERQYKVSKSSEVEEAKLDSLLLGNNDNNNNSEVLPYEPIFFPFDMPRWPHFSPEAINKRRIQRRWFLLLLLHFNPSLIKYRKHNLVQFRENFHFAPEGSVVEAGLKKIGKFSNATGGIQVVSAAAASSTSKSAAPIPLPTTTKNNNMNNNATSATASSLPKPHTTTTTNIHSPINNANQNIIASSALDDFEMDPFVVPLGTTATSTSTSSQQQKPVSVWENDDFGDLSAPPSTNNNNNNNASAVAVTTNITPPQPLQPVNSMNLQGNTQSTTTTTATTAPPSNYKPVTVVDFDDDL